MSPARLTKKKERRHKLLTLELKEETSFITTNPVDIESIRKAYYEQLYFHKSDNLDKKN